jgi:hypothetical protein
MTKIEAQAELSKLRDEEKRLRAEMEQTLKTYFSYSVLGVALNLRQIEQRNLAAREL